MISSMEVCTGSLPVSFLWQQIRSGNDLGVEDPLSDALPSPQCASPDLVGGVRELVFSSVRAQAFRGDAECFGYLPAGHQFGAGSGENPGIPPLAVGPSPFHEVVFVPKELLGGDAHGVGEGDGGVASPH